MPRALSLARLIGTAVACAFALFVACDGGGSSGGGDGDDDYEPAHHELSRTSDMPYDRLLIRDGDLYMNGERFIVKAVDLTFVWPGDVDARRRIIENVKALGANTVRYGFYTVHENIDLLEEAGLYVLLLPLNSWNTHMTPDEMRAYVAEFAEHKNIIGWHLGNELWSNDFSIPVDLIAEQMAAIEETDPLKRPVFYGNHMLLNAPDMEKIPFLPALGFGPVDFVDVIGWNAYPLFLALSLDEMIGYFWYSIKPYIEQFSPGLAELLDEAFKTYQQWADNMPQQLLDSAVGMDYLMNTYWINSCEQDWDGERYHPKPWMLTEWGFTNSADGIRNVCAVILEYVEFGSLDGLDFHPYLFLDEDADGVIDHPDAYQALVDCFARVGTD